MAFGSIRQNPFMMTLPGPQTLHIVFVRFEVFMAVTMKNGVFSVLTPCGSCRTNIPPKRQFLQEPHSVTSHKTPFYIISCFTKICYNGSIIFFALKPSILTSYMYNALFNVVKWDSVSFMQSLPTCKLFTCTYITVALKEILWETNNLLSFLPSLLSISQRAIRRLQAPHTIYLLYRQCSNHSALFGIFRP
jgi:hypothetical protein